MDRFKQLIFPLVASILESYVLAIILSGMFNNFDEMDGMGTYTWSTGKVYFGPFRGGKFDTSGQ